VVPVLIAVSGIAIAPLALPVLPVESYIAYAQSLGVTPSTAERKELAQLPQFFADMHGWREIAAGVAEVWEQLSPEEQERTAIFANNYGDAGAVDYFGPELGLPPAISGHNNYWFWGPGDGAIDVVIIIGGEREGAESVFESVEPAATIDCGYCMPYENGQTVWIGRQPKVSVVEIWRQLRHFD
jgi:hypothetical protein